MSKEPRAKKEGFVVTRVEHVFVPAQVSADETAIELILLSTGVEENFWIYGVVDRYLKIADSFLDAVHASLLIVPPVISRPSLSHVGEVAESIEGHAVRVKVNGPD